MKRTYVIVISRKKIRETVKPPIHVLFVKYNGIKIIKYTKEGFTKKKRPADKI